jgi:cytochrome c oxidase subunit 2
MPGSENTIKTVAYEEGTYQGYCTEYCGVAHSQMYFTVKVVSQDEYEQWVDDQQSSSSSGDIEVEGDVTPGAARGA